MKMKEMEKYYEVFFELGWLFNDQKGIEKYIFLGVGNMRIRNAFLDVFLCYEMTKILPFHVEMRQMECKKKKPGNRAKLNWTPI